MMKPLVAALVFTLIVDPVLAQVPGAGFLGQPQVGYGPMGNMYNQVGTPVAGAWQGNNMAMAGTGSQMMTQCPYQQQVYVNPTDSDPGVVAARTDLSSMDTASKEARLEAMRIKLELQRAKTDLGNSLKRGKADAFIENMDRCESFSDEIKDSDKDAFLGKIGDEYDSNDDSEKVGCYFAAFGKTNGKSGFHAEGLCMAMDTSIDYDYVTTPAPSVGGPVVHESRPSRDDGPTSRDSAATTKCKNGKLKNGRPCPTGLDLESTGGETKTINDAPSAPTFTNKTLHGKANTDNKSDCGAAADKVHNLKKELKDAEVAANKAHEELEAQLRKVAQARKDAAATQALQAQIDAEKITAQTAGVVGCATCAQKPSVNQGLVYGGLALGLVGMLGSFYLGKQAINNDGRLGYVTTGMSTNNAVSSFSTGASIGAPLVAAGLSGVGNGGGVGAYGYPMNQNGIYGTAPGGFAQGGFGCGQTANMSPFAMNQGAMYPGGYPGMFPGGYQMPGMTQYGIPGNQGFNPYAQQQMMQNYFSDQQRAMYLAQSTAQMGINQAQQQFSLANSYLMGAGNMPYSTYQQPYSLLGQSAYGGSSYFGGAYGSSYGSPFARSGCGTNPYSLGTSFSICGTTTLGGYATPTYTNGYNGLSGYNPYGTSLGGTATFSR